MGYHEEEPDCSSKSSNFASDSNLDDSMLSSWKKLTKEEIKMTNKHFKAVLKLKEEQDALKKS